MTAFNDIHNKQKIKYLKSTIKVPRSGAKTFPKSTKTS